ncbi:DUF1345 domain-containing protein [Deinococcus sp. QL22]|uniref:DUF1345 domain-containing protein n=1 Tax=Deinococcus sp. QL22 TaxID=2939437 RepID=UPI002017070C|nr:DUF1345 domain-containing protein [Deinococcus sp. QL22]UQN05039.1 DUF1345 domain-containing protein [Deinococcus sp. QL22]
MPHESRTAGTHLAVAAGAGALVWLLLTLFIPRGLPWEGRALFGWVSFCAVHLLRLWGVMLHCGGQRTKAIATREDDTRAVSAFLTTITALVSLVGVGYALHEAGPKEGLDKVGITALAVLTVVLSWVLVHTQYTLHYAHRYYDGGAGGVIFLDNKEGESGTLSDPDYRDFAYLSFTIGMTFQVSDTNLTSRAMRRLLLEHALLSYVFVTVIIAVTINAVAGLVG